MTTNICKAIDCPYYCDQSAGYGCRLYAVALHCHLIHRGDVDRRRDNSLAASSTQYALYTQEERDLDEMKKCNEDWLRQSDTHRRDSMLFDKGICAYPTRIIDGTLPLESIND